MKATLSTTYVKFTHVLPQLLTFFFGWLLWTNGIGQTVIGSYELTDLSLEQEIYPYAWVDFAGDTYGVCSRPAVRLSENEFVYLQKPKTDNQKRVLTCFNVLAEPQWENHLRLAKEEELFRLYLHQGDLIALTYRKQRKPWRYTVQARLFAPNDGSPLPRKNLYSFESDRPSFIRWNLSPDSSLLMLYHFEPIEGKRKLSATTFPHNFDKIGYKVTNVHKLCYTLYGENLAVVDSGEMMLNFDAKDKIFALDSQVDNEGNIYLTSYSEEKGLTIFQQPASAKETIQLSYPRYPNPFSHTPYVAHRLPSCQPSGNILAAHAVRERIKGKWHTTQFRVLAFDFDKKRVDTARTANLTTSFSIKIAKDRQAANLKPNMKFDGHIIKELFELEDGTAWLMTQRYTLGAHPLRYDHDHRVIGDDLNSTLEEIILYEFTPDKQAKKAIILPMLQQANSALERASRFYSMEVNPNNREIHLITREYDGDKMDQPPRMFYRHISLDSGLYSDRQLIYDGKHKNQFYIRAYTLFLNPQVAVMMVVNGSRAASPEVVSVKLE